MYWRRPDATYIYWEHTTESLGLQTGTARIIQTRSGWRVVDLPTSQAPVAIEAAVCRECIWKPPGGRYFRVDVTHSSEIARRLKIPFARFSDSSPEPWAASDIGVIIRFDQIAWIDQRHAFVAFNVVSHLGNGDEVQMHALTWLVQYRDRHWTAYDVGLPSIGE